MQTLIQIPFYLLLFTILVGCQRSPLFQKRSPCYNQKGQPIKCYTPFVNPAFKLPVEVTNECGEDDYELFCMQAESTKTARSCDYCRATDKEKAHPAKYLTDNHSHENMTWWQSSTMVHNIQHPNSVNLTLHLGKEYIITYIRLTFFSSRPESFAIYKKNGVESEEWMPFQYFSYSCEDTYGIDPHLLITKDNEDLATCRDDSSDISPLTGGTVVFSTLEGRPSAYNYEFSPVLQDWVTATDIMISLNRINTFGDDVFRDKQVLSQYFYGIYDFSIGGRCKCYGHASECVNDDGKLKCLCQHNTDGADCQKCLPFFNDQPWHRATPTDAHECKPCDCNGLSETCKFDADLYQRTGHAGHCTNCRESTSGPHCEYCQHGHYHRPEDKKCIFCHCNPLGSINIQCNDYGVCACQPGVTGEKCDQCLTNYYNLSETGCTKCRCDPSGVMEGAEEACDTVTGQCYCKEFVTGQSCDQCMDTYFGLIHTNPLGCTSCFCYGHSSDCSLDPGHKVTTIRSSFIQGKGGWKGVGMHGEEANVEHLDIPHEISLVANDPQAYYFLAPEIYLGDLHRSYGLYIRFKLRTDNNDEQARPSIKDIIIESANGGTLTLPIFSQGNPMPTSETQEYRFLLEEHRNSQWMPSDLSYFEFARLLSNVTAIKIRGTYTNQGVGYLSDLSVETSRPAHEVPPSQDIQVMVDVDSTVVVEECQCPEGYDGQFCEACAPGFRRHQPFSAAFGACVPCECNGHSKICEPESGRCICEHNTKGRTCEFCQDGYYGNALNGTEDDCQQCGCPEDGRCIQLVSTGDIICLDCPQGYGGQSCDTCDEGYYSEGGSCIECNCNNNTHPNAIRVCDRDTGDCLGCKYNTRGDSCDQCLSGFYGNPVDEPHGQCHPCDCYELGCVAEEDDGDDAEESGEGVTHPSPPPSLTCDLSSGQCRCKPNVEGLKCDTCVNGTWNLFSGDGCEDCKCNLTGSVDGTCDKYTGHCHCKPGVGGEKCDIPLALHYGFSIRGALECQCDPYGSMDPQCDVTTGQCPCRHQYRGRKCDQCEMNRFDLRRGCVECPVCYNIVMEEAGLVSEQIERMKEVFQQAQDLPENFFSDDSEYNDLARKLRGNLEKLEESMKNNGRTKELQWFVEATKEYNRINTVFANITDNTTHLPGDIDTNKGEIKTASEMLEAFKEELDNLTSVLETQKKDLLEQIRERQRQSGRQSDDLTNVAQQAREDVVDLETKLDEIDENLKLASNTSQQIIDLHYTWSHITADQEESLDALTNLNALMAEKYTKVKVETTEAIERINSLLNDSEVLMNDISGLEVPEVDNESLNTSGLLPLLKQESQKAEDQHKVLENLNSHFFQLQRNLTYLLSATSVALADRKALDQSANEAHNRSLSAWKKVEDVFVEANTILETFKAFDQKIEESRLKSEEAIDSLGDDENKSQKDIQDTLHLTIQNLRGSEEEKNVNDVEYQNIDTLIQIYNRTQDLEKIEKEFDETEDSAKAIGEFVSEVDQQLDEVEGELDALEMENHNETLAVEELEDTIDQLKILMANINTVAERTSQQADELKHYFEHSLDPIEEEKMKLLSEEIEEFSRPANDIIYHKVFETLESDLEKSKNTTKEYTDELRQFEADVENLELISSTIPEVCFKPVALEPTYKESEA